MYSPKPFAARSYINVGALTITSSQTVPYTPSYTIVPPVDPYATTFYNDEDDIDDFNSDEEDDVDVFFYETQLEMKRDEIDYVSGKPKRETPCRHEARRVDAGSRCTGCVSPICPYLHDDHEKLAVLAKSGVHRYPYGLTPVELTERKKKFDEINSDPKKLQDYHEKVLKTDSKENSPSNPKISVQFKKNRMVISTGYGYFSEKQTPAESAEKSVEKSSKKKRRGKKSKGAKNSE